MPGDIILSFNNQKIDNFQQFRNIVAATPIGHSVPARIFRNGSYKTIFVVIGDQEDYKDKKTSDPDTVSSQSKNLQDFGLEISELTPDLAKRFRRKSTSGVIVTGVEQGSSASR